MRDNNNYSSIFSQISLWMLISHNFMVENIDSMENILIIQLSWSDALLEKVASF
jgi:hypothetical protein